MKPVQLACAVWLALFGAIGGAGAAEKAALAAGLGFRTFLVGDAAPEGARAVTAAQAIEAARGARARERWKAARGSGG